MTLAARLFLLLRTPFSGHDASASGSLTRKGRAIYLNSQMGFGQLQAVGTVKFEVFKTVEFEVCKIDSDLLPAVNIPTDEQPILIYTIPEQP